MVEVGVLMERGLISRQLERIGGSHFFGGIFPLKSARCRAAMYGSFSVSERASAGELVTKLLCYFAPLPFCLLWTSSRGRPLAEMDNKALQKRVLRRTMMVLGLRISHPEVHSGQLLVHTLDITSSGAKIGGVREYIHSGSVLLIQRGHNRTHCRVIWSRGVGPKEIHMGVEFLKHSARFWELDLDEATAGVWLSSSQR